MSRVMKITHTLLFVLSIGIFYKGMFRRPVYLNEINHTGSNKPVFKKLIYYVIDGLRYDACVKIESNNLYHNNLDFSYANHTSLFATISGIPTATTCRVYSLLTGKPNNQLEHLFAFLHVGKESDSLVEQCLFHGKTISHYGDRIWIDLCPKITQTVNFESYGKHRLKEKEQETHDAFIKNINSTDVSIIHMISVDSYGHWTNDLNHELLQERLQTFQKWIKEIYSKMSQDTLLVVLSDHGVTKRGEHGGSSDEERGGMCCFMSKKPTVNEQKPQKWYKRVFKKTPTNKQFDKVKLFTEDKKHKLYTNDFLENHIDNPQEQMIHQDEILSTVCKLTGLNVPMNASGSLIKKFNLDVSDVLDIQQRICEDNKINVEDILVKYTAADNQTRHELSDELSERIRKELFSIDLRLCTLSIIIQFYLWLHALKGYRPSFADIPGLILIFQDSTSYWSFAFRDLVIIATLIIMSCDVNCILLAILYFKRDKTGHFEEYRENMQPEKHLEKIRASYIVATFVLIHLYRNRKNMLAEYCKIFNSLMMVLSENPILSLGTVQSIFATGLLQCYQTIHLVSTLNFSYFSKTSAILLSLIHFTRFRGNTNKVAWLKFLLQNMIYHCYNFDFNLTAVDWNLAFKYSDRIDYILIFLGGFVYFAMNRVYMLFNTKHVYCDTGKVKKHYLLITKTLMLLSCASAMVMHGDMTWARWFADRFIIMSIHSVLDSLFLTEQQ